jgi:hypothetical protein
LRATATLAFLKPLRVEYLAVMIQPAAPCIGILITRRDKRDPCHDVSQALVQHNITGGLDEFEVRIPPDKTLSALAGSGIGAVDILFGNDLLQPVYRQWRHGLGGLLHGGKFQCAARCQKLTRLSRIRRGHKGTVVASAVYEPLALQDRHGPPRYCTTDPEMLGDDVVAQLHSRAQCAPQDRSLERHPDRFDPVFAASVSHSTSPLPPLAVNRLGIAPQFVRRLVSICALSLNARLYAAQYFQNAHLIGTKG